MDEKREQTKVLGMIEKAASLSAHAVTEEDLKAINKYALTPLTAEEVFVFRAVLCDNEVDRHHERFSLKALKGLKKLFLGKTVIKDHYASADNQVARIYATELEETDTQTSAGEKYTRLMAKCYMVKTASNADLIAEIKGGIKKEGSVGCSVEGAICSICGTDNAKAYCPHYPGRSYAVGNEVKTCTFLLDGAKDAYEFSLVAVPAQRAAGASKNYTGETVYAGKEEEPAQNNEADAEKAKELELRARLAANKAREY